MPARKSRVQDLLFEHNDPRHVLADAFSIVECWDLLVEEIRVCRQLSNLYRRIATDDWTETPSSGPFRIWGKLVLTQKNVPFNHIEMKANNGEDFTYCISARTSQVCRVCAVAEVMEV